MLIHGPLLLCWLVAVAAYLSFKHFVYSERSSGEITRLPRRRVKVISNDDDDSVDANINANGIEGIMSRALQDSNLTLLSGLQAR